MSTLKISARQAGMVEVEKYCARCFWYYLRLKKFPYEFGSPGIMFYLEQMQKAHIQALMANGPLPAYFGPFADCTEPVQYPYAMERLHTETDVLLTARVDMLLRKKDGNLCLLDLKTSKFDGGGHVFLPQYEVQTIGYSWVAEQAKLGHVATAGLLYCEVQKEAFLQDPEKYRTDSGISVPFNFKPYEVKLDYDRLTKCLIEAKAVWQCTSPPQGAAKCKECQLLTRLFDFEAKIQADGRDAVRYFPELYNSWITQEYWRGMTRCSDGSVETLLTDEGPQPEDTMWADWSFS